MLSFIAVRDPQRLSRNLSRSIGSDSFLLRLYLVLLLLRVVDPNGVRLWCSSFVESPVIVVPVDSGSAWGDLLNPIGIPTGMVPAMLVRRLDPNLINWRSNSKWFCISKYYCWNCVVAVVYSSWTV